MLSSSFICGYQCFIEPTVARFVVEEEVGGSCRTWLATLNLQGGPHNSLRTSLRATLLYTYIVKWGGGGAGLK